MKKIIYKGVLLGIKIDKIAAGSRPLTEPKEFIQIVTLKHPHGTYLPAHYHQPQKRQTTKLQECMMVKKGRVQLDLYTLAGEPATKIFLKAGQAFVFLNCGVGVKILQDAEIIEVKNGPFKIDKILI